MIQRVEKLRPLVCTASLAMPETGVDQSISTPERAAEAIYQAGLGRRPERYVPRPYALASAIRILAPGLVRRVLGGPAAAAMTTTTGADMAERRNGSGAISRP